MANIAGYKASKAHSLVDKAIRDGDLIRANKCELCDSVGSEENLIIAHHYKGYNDPLDIWWICHSCNMTLKGKHDGSLTKEQAQAIIRQRRQEVKPKNYYASKVADIIKTRKRNIGSYHTLSRQIHSDLLPSTLRSACQGRSISPDALQKIAHWAARNNDKELLNALVSYVLGIDIGDVYIISLTGDT